MIGKSKPPRDGGKQPKLTDRELEAARVRRSPPCAWLSGRRVTGQGQRVGAGRERHETDRYQAARGGPRRINDFLH
jgi:hypothetical protein